MNGQLRPLPRTANSPTTDHKVTVRFCAGYGCRETVTTHRVRQNVHGHREYHSLLCYSRWSPEMREVIARFPDYAQTPMGLEMLILDLRREAGILGAAETLKLSRSTVAYWLHKLQSFRQFAGQDPDQILMLLHRISKESGVERAAKLVAVDPKTLSLALEKAGFTDQEPLPLAS